MVSMTMAVNKDFVKKIEALCMEALRTPGFKKRSAKIATLEITAEISGWIGLNTAIRNRERMVVNPFIGLRHHPLQKVLAEIDGDEASNYSPPTLSLNLGYMMPGGKPVEFEFTLEGDSTATARSLAESVQQFGVPFIKENASLQSIIQLLPAGAIWEDGSERLLVALFLAGRSREELDQFVAERHREGATKKVCLSRFTEFAEKFMRYIDRA